APCSYIKAPSPGSELMATLAQAYIHLRPYELNEARLQEFGSLIEALSREAAQLSFKQTVSIDVDIETGSAWTWVTVAGSIAFGVYGGIANYKGFKESIVEIEKDARNFGQLVRDYVTNAAGPERVYRAERRTMTPGRLRRLTDRLEQLNE